MKILMVLTSHDKLGDTSEKTGFWLEELAAPYYVFKDAGVEITLASPLGGQPPLDPKSDAPASQTASTRRFRADPAAQTALASTLKLREVSAGNFDAVFYPGGHGPLWDLAEDASSIALIEAMLVAGNAVAPDETCASAAGALCNRALLMPASLVRFSISVLIATMRVLPDIDGATISGLGTNGYKTPAARGHAITL